MKSFISSLLMLLIVASIAGCSGDKKSNSRPAAKASGVNEDAANEVATLTASEGSTMVFTLEVEGQTVAQLSGAVTEGMQKEDALVSADGSQSADVLTLQRKNAVFVVFHKDASGDLSRMYLFTENRGEYSKLIGPVSIARDAALAQINQAIELNMEKKSLSEIQAIYQMQADFEENPTMTFSQYLDKLAGSAPIAVADVGGGGSVGSGQQGTDILDKDSGGNANGEWQGSVTPDAPARQFPGAIKPSVVHTSPRPVARPLPRPPAIDGDRNLEPVDRVPGVGVTINCTRAHTKIVANGQDIVSPIMRACIDRTGLKAKFRGGFRLTSLDHLENVRNMMFLINFDLNNEDRFIRGTEFHYDLVNGSKRGADKKESSLFIYGSGDDRRIEKSMSVQTSKGDSVSIGLNCVVRKIDFRCP